MSCLVGPLQHSNLKEILTLVLMPGLFIGIAHLPVREPAGNTGPDDSLDSLVFQNVISSKQNEIAFNSRPLPPPSGEGSCPSD